MCCDIELPFVEWTHKCPYWNYFFCQTIGFIFVWVKTFFKKDTILDGENVETFFNEDTILDKKKGKTFFREDTILDEENVKKFIKVNGYEGVF